MAREYFQSYHSYLEAMKSLNDAECGRLYRACLTYSMTGIAPELRGNERFIFDSMKGQIDRDIENYAIKCEQNRDNVLRRYTNVNERIRTHTKPTKEKEKEKEIIISPSVIPPANTFARFDEFWREYPRKINKANAQKAWGKLKPDDALVDKMMKAVAEQKKSVSWTKDGGQFIPHAATWLNGQRWEDEVGKPPPKRRTSTHNHSTRNYTPEELGAIGRDLLEDV
jgi:hypothetical protein